MHVLRDDPRNFSVLRSEPSATSVSRDPEPSAARNFRHAAERRQQIAQQLKRKLQTIERAQDFPKRRGRNPRRTPTLTSAHCVGRRTNERTCSCCERCRLWRVIAIASVMPSPSRIPSPFEGLSGVSRPQKVKATPLCKRKTPSNSPPASQTTEHHPSNTKTSVAAALRGINWRRS
jgi:hypothetical protein